MDFIVDVYVEQLFPRCVFFVLISEISLNTCVLGGQHTLSRIESGIASSLSPSAFWCCVIKLRIVGCFDYGICFWIQGWIACQLSYNEGWFCCWVIVNHICNDKSIVEFQTIRILRMLILKLHIHHITVAVSSVAGFFCSIFVNYINGHFSVLSWAVSWQSSIQCWYNCVESRLVENVDCGAIRFIIEHEVSLAVL